MKSKAFLRGAALVIVLSALLIGSGLPPSIVSAQSGRQPPRQPVEKKTDVQKGADQSGKPQQPESQEQAPPVPKDLKDQLPIKLSTQVVNVDATVIDKKTGRLYTKLTKKDFTIYEDGVKQDLTNFRSGEGPMTAVLLLENNFRNRYYTNYFDPTFFQEIFRSAATFVQGFVKPQDHIAVVTFSMRPKVITDFTGDSQRLYQAVASAARDTLNFSESNIYDALSFTLLGGKAIQLYNENAGESEYTGLEELEGHTAVILITLGRDTFSRITYDKALKIVAGAGVPVFTVQVGNLWFKKYGDQLPPTSRMEYLQAANALNTFSEWSGGMFFPMTFEGEIPQIMHSIEAMLRGQYSLGYVPSNTRREGKERKIKLDVDVDGDGQPDNKRLEIKFRSRYVEPDDNAKAKKK